MSARLDAVRTALSQIQDPDLKRSVTDLGMVAEVAELQGAVTVTFDMSVTARDAAQAQAAAANGPASQRAHTSTATRRQRLGADTRALLGQVDGVTSVDVRWNDAASGRAIAPDDPLPTVRNIVLVMSGKGGVGKSTTATNLALALHRAGFRVGLLDADIYGPSIPTMLGVSGRPVSLDGKTIEPLERFGVKLMSIGFLLEDPKAAIIWRGPMLHGALQQFLKDVHWGELDYLVLDLPPGTGDVALTLSQRIKASGAVIVTTPQPVATDDVFKSVSMCEKVNIPIIGVVENMSYFIDSAGVRHDLFGKGGGQAVADFAKAPLLGQVPIDQSVREWGDRGTPVVKAAPFSPIARTFVELAEGLVDRIAAMRAEGGGGPGQSESDSEGENGGDGPPLIDRTGGGGTPRKRLPIAP